MKSENKTPNTSANGVPIKVGDIVQEKDAGYIGRVVAVDGNAMLYRPFGGQDISDTDYANCDECNVLTKPMIDKQEEPEPEEAKPDLARVQERCQEFEAIHDELVLFIKRLDAAMNKDWPFCRIECYGPGDDCDDILESSYKVRSRIADTIGEFKAVIAILQGRQANAA